MYSGSCFSDHDQNILASYHKGGIKATGKLNRRIGRLAEKYAKLVLNEFWRLYGGGVRIRGRF